MKKKGPQLTRTAPSSFQRREAPVYCFEPGDCMEVESSDVNYPTVCFSFYAAVISGEEKYQVKLYDLDLNVVQTEEMTISSTWNRYFISIKYDKGITKVRAALTFIGKGNSECAIDFPQIEKGISPSSPMEPGTSRSSDNVCYNLNPSDKYNERGTIAVQFSPNQWQSNMLLASENRTVFSLVGIDGDAIIVCFSGRHKGGLCLIRRIDGEDKYEEANFFLGNDQMCLVTFSYDSTSSFIYVKGIPVYQGGPININKYCSILLGATPIRVENIEPKSWVVSGGYTFTSPLVNSPLVRSSEHSLQAIVRNFIPWAKTFYHSELVELAGKICIPKPIKVRYRGDNLAENYIGHEEAHFIDELISCVETNERYIKSQDVEERIRDYYALYLEGKDWLVDRETHQGVGRTDLLVRSSNNEILGKKIRVEFKIWGRPGYKDAPDQPIKYMESSERFAVFIMYDYSANDKYDKMIHSFLDNKAYPNINMFIDERNELVRSPHRVFLSEHKRTGVSDCVSVLGIYVRVPPMNKMIESGK